MFVTPASAYLASPSQLILFHSMIRTTLLPGRHVFHSLELKCCNPPPPPPPLRLNQRPGGLTCAGSSCLWQPDQRNAGWCRQSAALCELDIGYRQIMQSHRSNLFCPSLRSSPLKSRSGVARKSTSTRSEFERYKLSMKSQINIDKSLTRRKNI